MLLLSALAATADFPHPDERSYQQLSGFSGIEYPEIGVTAAPALSRSAWRGIIARMGDNFKMYRPPISAEVQLYAYLVAWMQHRTASLRIAAADAVEHADAAAQAAAIAATGVKEELEAALREVERIRLAEHGTVELRVTRAPA